MLKRLRNFLASMVLLAGLLISAAPLPVQADGTNLIANPSVEDNNGTAPTGWTANSWGTNTTTLSYANSGHTGSKSLRIDMSARTDGDAKWMSSPVSVTPNTSYTYSSFYQSNVDTEIDLQYTDTNGAVSYAYAQYVPASAGWNEISTTFTTPASAASVVVLHIIAAPGWLQTDDFNLTTTVVAPPPVDNNLIANASFETANGAAPAGWQHNSWGTNSPNFVYENSGRTGSRSVTTTISSIASGDAKWFFSPVAITGGTNYTYSDYYKSATASRVVAAFIDSNGNYSYAELASAAPSTTWTQYTTSFAAPTGAAKVTIFHLLDITGSLTIDDTSLTETGATPPPPPPPPPVDTENLIANPSFETAAGATPQSWQNNSWGTNSPSFVYQTTGRTGSHSVTTLLSSATSGDAKWFFSPVTITGGKMYLYRDYYKANVTSRVVVAFIDASGNYSYQEIATAPTSADWKLYEAGFTAPATAAKVTVFHLIDRVGSLTIDDTLLQTAVPPVSNIDIPNGSVELGNTTPLGWQKSSWGQNTATYQVVAEGHTGNQSVKVTVNNYVSGDAKWFFDPINTLTPGQQYRITAWYKGTALPHAVVDFITADGTEHYVGLPSPQTISSTSWQKFSETFTVPQGTTGVTAFLFVTSNGWLQTDDYSLATYHPSGFNRPLLSLTFDDGHEDNVDTALPLLEQYGFKSTQCYATTFLEGMPQSVINDVLAFHNAGHEICSHTVTHPFLTTLNNTQLTYELQHSQAYLESIIGEPVRDFASPYGDYNATVNDVVKQYYQSHRTVDEGFNSKDNFDIYRLRVQNILDTTSAAQVQAWVEQAQADNTWLILVYHRVASDPGPYDSYTNVFAEHLAAIANSGIAVKTMQGALDEVLPQMQ